METIAVDTIRLLRMWVLTYLRLPYLALQWVYLKGPWLRGYGFWMGMQKEDICTALSNGVDASHWLKHPTVCHEMIDRHVTAFVISTLIVTLLGLTFLILTRRWLVNSIISELTPSMNLIRTTTVNNNKQETVL
jgi:hypothetical protein